MHKYWCWKNVDFIGNPEKVKVGVSVWLSHLGRHFRV
jgi:hypothetical protein